MNIFSQYKGLRKENYILFFGRLVTNLGSMVFPMLTLILNQKMGLSASRVSLVMVISGLALLPANLLGGKLADRFNKKHIIVVCDIVSILSYLAAGTMTIFMEMNFAIIAIIVVGGACQTMEGPAYNSLIADITPTKDRARAYSLQYLGSNIGLVASPTLAGLLLKDYLWLLFMVSAVSIGFSTMLIAWKVKNITPVREETDVAEYQKAKDKLSLRQVFRENKCVLLFLVIMAFYNGAYMQYNYLMPLELARVHGEEGPVLFGTVSSLNCIIVVFMAPIITRLFMRCTTTKKTLIGVILILSGYVAFLLMLGFIPGYYIAIFLFTLGEVFTTLSSGPYVSARIPASHRGRVNGVISIGESMMQGVSMIVSGFLYDAFGSVTAWSFVFIVLGAGILLSVFLILFDRKAYDGLYHSKDPYSVP